MYTILLIVLTSKCTIHVWKRQRRRLVDLIQILQHVWMTMFTRFLCGIDHWISRWFSANQIAKKWDEYSLASSFKTNLVIQLHDVDCAQSGNSSNVNSSIFLLINFLNQIDVKMLICQWKMWRFIKCIRYRTTINTFSAVSREHLVWVQLRNHSGNQW